MRSTILIRNMTDLSLKVLRCLADGGFHSGAALARAFHVTRGTIWNAMRRLDAAGLEIYRVRGRGYRLAHPVSLLDVASIERSARSAARCFEIELVDIADSTNTLLMERAASGARAGSVIVAEWQDHDGGRIRHVWHADVAGGLTFSVLWRFAQGASSLGGLSLAVGVALIRATTKLGACDVRLTWPNDMVWRGTKLAGMMIEMKGAATGPTAVVFGIDINVGLMKPIAGQINPAAADLEMACRRKLDRSAVLGMVLRELAQVLGAFARDGLGSMRAEWDRHHIHH
ncbi:MAG: biotin--[acetyl-CoA-carboxylase] ligase, partial [Betaproteobacteria bacterium]|nr:biotin--[acetyl-CoA-carboxylase] ligase [Betaproteobacteria bacterium]